MSESTPRQLLPVEAYRCPKWFEEEQRQLFARSWHIVAVEGDLAEPGAYKTLRIGPCNLILLRDQAGQLRAFHNSCRHRGTELLEGEGQLKRNIVCPYHHWTYGLDGALRGVPQEAGCFPSIDKSCLALHAAALEVFKGLVFLHPDAEPAVPFADWLASLPEAAWPHDLSKLTEVGSLGYEVKCNWKVFYENAIDGYHLAHLHRESLGGPTADRNIWEAHGRHLLWYASEQAGRKTALPQALDAAIAPGDRIEGAEAGDYAGIFLLYPASILSASPSDFSLTRLHPMTPERTLITVRSWGKAGGWLFGGGTKSPQTSFETITLADQKDHPMDSGDFMLEDLWICEKIQRAMASPHFAVGPLAAGAGGEAPLTWFQAQLLQDLGKPEKAA